MDKKLRDTGIEVIGEAFGNSHSSIYESKDDFLVSVALI